MVKADLKKETNLIYKLQLATISLEKLHFLWIDIEKQNIKYSYIIHLQICKEQCSGLSMAKYFS